MQKSTSVADFDDAKFVLALNNRLRRPDFDDAITYYSDAKWTSIADFGDAKLVLAMNNRLRWPILTMQKICFSDENTSTSVADCDDAKLIIAMQNRLRSPIWRCKKCFSDENTPAFGGRFWRCKTYFSDAKSTSVADFDDAKLILAMKNRLRWPIAIDDADFDKTNYSDAIIDFGRRFWRCKPCFSDE